MGICLDIDGVPKEFIREIKPPEDVTLQKVRRMNNFEHHLVQSISWIDPKSLDKIGLLLSSSDDIPIQLRS